QVPLKMSSMGAPDQLAEVARVVARIVRDPLSPSPALELAQLTLLLKQRVEALETRQRALEERLARLERPGESEL
ncbi:MAG: hypothetical protein ACREHD_10925, partial [Pirellulales bacterium]